MVPVGGSVMCRAVGLWTFVVQWCFGGGAATLGGSIGGGSVGGAWQFGRVGKATLGSLRAKIWANVSSARIVSVCGSWKGGIFVAC